METISKKKLKKLVWILNNEGRCPYSAAIQSCSQCYLNLRGEYKSPDGYGCNGTRISRILLAKKLIRDML